MVLLIIYIFIIIGNPIISTLFPYTTLSDLKDIRDEYNYPKKKGIKDECSRLLEASTMKSRRGNLEHSSRSEERFSRNAETDLVCRLLLEKKKKVIYCAFKLLISNCALIMTM